jgi:hypothetical protein
MQYTSTELVDSDVHNEEKSIEVSAPTEIIAVENEGFIDFEAKENWSIAYSYFKDLGKPINRIVKDWTSLQYFDTYEGGSFFVDSNAGVYAFSLEEFTNSDYTLLTGNEICNVFISDTATLFPSMTFPAEEDVQRYLEEYLGISLNKSEVYEGDYNAAFPENHVTIFISRARSEDGTVDVAFPTAEIKIRYSK